MYTVVLIDTQRRIQHECKQVDDPVQAILWHDIIMTHSKHSQNGYTPAITWDGRLLVGEAIHQLPSGRKAYA